MYDSLRMQSVQTPIITVVGELIRKIQDTILICPLVISQWAAVGAMKAGRSYCRQKLQLTAEIRKICLNELAGIADLVTVPPANGAFYFLLRVHRDLDPMDIVRRLIERHKIAVIPGRTFGVDDKCLLRIAYGALQKETVAEDIGRLVEGFNQILTV
jgi:aspartate/methionine/tyrosine aminotransferase